MWMMRRPASNRSRRYSTLSCCHHPQAAARPPVEHAATRQSTRGTAAFTLTELVVVSAILTSVVAGLGVVMTQSGAFVWERTDLRLTAMADAQRAMDRLTEDLRSASLATLGQGVGGGCSEAAGMSFRKFEPDPADPTQLVLSPFIIYTRVGTQLTRTVDGQAPQVVAGHVVLFAPVCQPGGVVWLRVSAQPPTNKASLGAVQGLSSKVWLKNP